MKMSFYAWGVVLLLGMCGLSALAQELPREVLVEADALVSDDDPNYCRGSRTYLWVCVSRRNHTYDTFLRFNLTALPAGQRFSKVMLQLHAMDSQAPMLLYRMPDAGDFWDELTITWNTRPDGGELLHTLQPWGIGFNTIDVTNVVNAEMTSGSNRIVTFRLACVGMGQNVLSSREIRSLPAHASRLLLEY